MRGGPSVEAAAVALRNGWAPLPWAYADVPDRYRAFGDLVLQRANELRADEWDRLTQAVGAQVGSVVARAFGAS
jgi:hypothetical protein